MPVFGAVAMATDTMPFTQETMPTSTSAGHPRAAVNSAPATALSGLSYDVDGNTSGWKTADGSVTTLRWDGSDHDIGAQPCGGGRGTNRRLPWPATGSRVEPLDQAVKRPT
ncbi:hypothetical protein [Amycolatopsis sp. H20-H5]|uniref:hypothetical protein n=1 Tax=Amycolatopsis sp. H20-H5 TaxID=3046309 RepID=UPI002DBA1979|nr:hypothetical protein [Amycolatopsis sp. H20-H5]MEC3978210.1 hypothetical protein [Amycolatopsis sp. H20-H5]